ncbi:MAG: ATP-binding cassette domain-containing protein [Eubacteriales bacterium]|nr:ATP-binding cassette domain-containing protein [Eubacteriales bacterium]
MIKIDNLCKSFEDKVLFDNYNIEIPDGSFIVISGESGCGKSTLLNMIGGIEKPDSGTIILDGINVSDRKNQRVYFRDKVGFLFQNFALIEGKTVRQNLEMVQKSGRSKTTIQEALEAVGLYKKIDQRVYKLSGGEQQRVALARLMIKKCSLILADEPTGSLDKKNGEIVIKVLHELNEQGKTVIVVTHNPEIVSREEKAIYL